jgi:hypothetical protein
MIASPVLPFPDLPELARPARTGGASTTTPAAEPPATATSSQPAVRRRPTPRTGLRPRPLVPTSLDEALQLGRAVVAARLAPRGMETPEACMIAILHGMEVGLSPMQALQRIAVVNGRPTIWGDGALALVQASGLAVSIIETIGGEMPDSWVATCTVLRRGEAQSVSRQFSVQDAKRARLWGRTGPWSEFPQRMLQMRARAFALRDVFADVLGGLYLHEELSESDEDGMSWTATRTTTVGAAPETKGTPPYHASCGDPATAEVKPEAPMAAIARPPSPPAHEARSRRKAPPPPWVKDPAAPARHDTDTRDAKPADVASAKAPEAMPGTDDIRDLGSQTDPAPALPPQRLRSMDLRLRRPSATAARRRFNEHWEVRRPRAIGEGKPRSIPARHRKPDPAVRASSVSVAQSGSETPDNLQAVPLTQDEELSLLDDALSCALDGATLDEILEEFAVRLARMPGEVRRRAGVVVERHRARVMAADSVGQPVGGGLDA